MTILPELEAYRARLLERCEAVRDSAPEDVAVELALSRERVRLIEKGIAALGERLGAAPAGDAERISHRISVQEQMRDLTAAYAEVLERHISGVTAGGNR